MKRIRNLERTTKALEEYDLFCRLWADAWIQDKLEFYGKQVGIAFGKDTAGQNDPKTCEECVRPGPRIPGPGEELSFVRRMVELWKKQKAVDEKTGTGGKASSGKESPPSGTSNRNDGRKRKTTSGH